MFGTLLLLLLPRASLMVIMIRTLLCGIPLLSLPRFCSTYSFASTPTISVIQLFCCITIRAPRFESFIATSFSSCSSGSHSGLFFNMSTNNTIAESVSPSDSVYRVSRAIIHISYQTTNTILLSFLELNIPGREDGETLPQSSKIIKV